MLYTSKREEFYDWSTATMSGVRWTPSAVLLSLVLVAACLCSVEAGAKEVCTTYGVVRGTIRVSSEGRRFHAFYNIPYARPPVGAWRFWGPEPPSTWTYIRNATTPGPKCMQHVQLLPDPLICGEEDCLYLNVFTPQIKPEKPLPVMFWIHGGGWINGGADDHEPGYLLNHDIVLVTINYRLGPLGFLSTEDAASTGNYGLKDQVAALRWVRDNIAYFGGDPYSVTIFGQGSGGASVHYHMLSPLSKGLFHRAISQSGVAVAPWAVPLPGGLQWAQELACPVGCPKESTFDLVNCLIHVEDCKIVNTSSQLAETCYTPLIPFRPVVEGEGEASFLPRHPLELKPHTAVPWLVGVTHDEGLVFAAACIAYKELLEDLKQHGETLFPLTLSYYGDPKANLITKKIKDFYFPNGDLSIDRISALYTDALFVWKTDEAVRQYKNTAPVYYYLFSYRGKYRMSKAYGGGDLDLGVAHGDDLFYLFRNNPYYPRSGDMPKEDYDMVKTMTKLWTDFAKTGNPTPDNKPVHWPHVTSDGELEYLDIGKELKVKKGLFQQRVDFWKSLLLRVSMPSHPPKDEL